MASTSEEDLLQGIDFKRRNAEERPDPRNKNDGGGRRPMAAPGLLAMESMEKLHERIEMLEGESIRPYPISEITYPRVANRDIDNLNEQNKEFMELVEDIRLKGQIMPILIRPTNIEGFKYEIVYGRRRFTALKLLGVETVEAYSRELDDKMALLFSYEENANRAALSPYEEGLSFHSAINSGQVSSARELSRVLGVSPGNLSEKLMASKYPEWLIDFIQNPYQLTIRQMRSINKLIKSDQDFVLLKERVDSLSGLKLGFNARITELIKPENDQKPSAIEVESRPMSKEGFNEGFYSVRSKGKGYVLEIELPLASEDKVRRFIEELNL